MSDQIFTINGMHCEACTKLSAKRIKKIEGVIDATVTLETKTAVVHASRQITTNEINVVLADSDYRAEEQK